MQADARRTQEHQHFKDVKGRGSRKGNQKKKVGFLLLETNPDSGKERFYLKKTIVIGKAL